jgi:hypothetical protein
MSHAGVVEELPRGKAPGDAAGKRKARVCGAEYGADGKSAARGYTSRLSN